MRWVLKHPRLADALFKLDPWGNPFSDEALRDPMGLADEMRAGGAVQWKPMYQQWFVLGYDEAREVLSSPHVGTRQQAEVLLDVPPYTKLSSTARNMFSNLLLLTDPPQHTRLRGLVNRAFTPRQVSRLDQRMSDIIDRLIEQFPDGEVELMDAFAVPFPARIIADLFGLPGDEWEWLRKVSQTLSQLIDPFRGFEVAAVDDCAQQLHDRVVALANERRADPKDDLITGLALAQDEDGDRLSEDELVGVAAIILIAGHETTAGMIPTSLLALCDNPDQRALIESRPELWPNAVEELLRYDTSLKADPRFALEEFELGGQKIKRGKNVLVLNQMANRDLNRFADADELRLDRKSPAPISFGHGIHYCLGANLAKAELGAALPRLLEALGDYTIDKDRVEWRPSVTLRVPDRFPIRRG